jgi:ubiquinone/menaquinone biosynthesis C-methylase UbiE/uncharacterized protein YbaR (Trm112 family)
MNTSALPYFVCPNCRAGDLKLEVYAGKGDRVDEGRLTCPGCAVWYRIESSVVDLLPLHLRRQHLHLYEDFAKKHGLPAKDLAGKGDSYGKDSQIEHFHENADEYEETVVNSPYYKALDENTFLQWAKALKPGELVLDLGCGTGRQCIPFAKAGLRTIGVDIAEEMVKLGQGKLDKLGLSEKVDLIVGDAENPPVKNEAFDAAICYGVLHHLPDKVGTIANAAKKLKPHGRWYALDPHKSPVRFIFDFMMRFWKLYDEEASDHPLLTEREMMDWMSAAGVQGKTRLTTYLPPHINQFLPHGANVALLAATDMVLSSIPGVRNCAGVIVSEGVKLNGKR